MGKFFLIFYICSVLSYPYGILDYSHDIHLYCNKKKIFPITSFVALTYFHDTRRGNKRIKKSGLNVTEKHTQTITYLHDNPDAVREKTKTMGSSERIEESVDIQHMIYIMFFSSLRCRNYGSFCNVFIKHSMCQRRK